MTEAHSYTAQEWQTITAMRQMPFNRVYEAAAQELEYLIAERTGERIASVELGDDTCRWIDELVRSGRFNTRGEVVAEAVSAFMRDHPILPTDDEQPEAEEAGPGEFVVEATATLRAFAVQLLERRAAGDAPSYLELEDQRVELPAAVVDVLHALAEPLSVGADVRVTPVPLDPAPGG